MAVMAGMVIGTDPGADMAHIGEAVGDTGAARGILTAEAHAGVQAMAAGFGSAGNLTRTS